MSGGGEKGGLRRPPGEDGVGRDGGAVDEQIAAGQERAGIAAAIRRGELEGGQHAGDRVGGRRGGLVHVEEAVVVLDEKVGERSTGIDGESHRHESALLGSPRVASLVGSKTARSYDPAPGDSRQTQRQAGAAP